MEMGKVGHTGELYLIAMVTLNMIINKEKGQLLLRYQK